MEQLIGHLSRIALERVMAPTRDLDVWTAQPVIVSFCTLH